MKLSWTLFYILLLLVSTLGFSQVNDECSDMEPFCPNPGLTFTANASGISAMAVQPTNAYDCLLSTPNSTWYYCVITQSGSINLQLSAWQDIDFIIYGPFADTTAAFSACGNMGNGGAGGNVIDCSYSPTNMEFPSIPNAFAGEVYVFLITNYASVVQDLTIFQTGGTGHASCSILQGCISSPGTYTITKNGITTNSPVVLAPGDNFEIISNNDYSLPLDTIPQPLGDGIYSAQLMWLIYSDAPYENDPSVDAGFLGDVIPDTVVSDINSALSPIINSHGCGTYWFVPVAGDDGIGGNNNVANGTTDNGGVIWDRNSNDCFQLGVPVEVVYTCPLQSTAIQVCSALIPSNKIEIDITGGYGNYSIINMGEGDLQSTVVANGGTAIITNLENGDNWEVQIIDENGLSMMVNGIFLAATINSVNLTPALTCPSAGTGSVDVNVNSGSGNGAPYSIYMASDPATIGTSDSYSDVAGTIVNIIVADNDGCYTDTIVTIPSSGHFINIASGSTDVTCYGDSDGSAFVNAIPTPSGNLVSITWTGPSGQHPGGNPGGSANNSQTNLESGTWLITAEDDFGCEVTVAVEIETPQQLILYTSIDNEPSCFGFADGNLTNIISGGVAPYIVSTNINNPSPGVTNLLAGMYIIYATDQNNCLDSSIIILNEPDSLYFTLLGGDNSSGNSDGSVYSLVGGGMPEYTYMWTNLNELTTHTTSSWNDIEAGSYEIVATDALGCSISDTVVIGTLKLNELYSSFTVYPNPATSLQFFVSAELKGYAIKIFDLCGKVVYEQNLNEGINPILVDFGDGIYIYEIGAIDSYAASNNIMGKLIIIKE